MYKSLAVTACQSLFWNNGKDYIALYFMKQILPICLFLLLMTGCKERPEVTASLDRAEALMESAPDSALTLLQSLDTETFLRRSTHARHALLFTQAQDKNYIDETNDSLISIAVDYYRQHGDVRPRFLSLYYNGRVLTNAGDHLNAMLSYAEAEELVDELRDNYYTGLLYTQMGDAYGEYYDFPKSLEAYQKAEKHYYTADKGLHYLYALVNQSIIYRNLNDYAMSDSLLHFVLKEAEIIENFSLQKLVLGDLVMLYIEQERFTKAMDWYEKELIPLVGEDYGSSTFMGNLAQMYAFNHNFVNVEKCVKKGWEYAENRTDSANMYIIASYIYHLQGKEDEAYQYLQKGVSLQNHSVLQALQQPVLTAQRDYLSEKLEFEIYRSMMEERLRTLSVLFFSLLLLVIIFAFNRIMKKKKATIDKLGKEKKRVESENRILLQQLDEGKKESAVTMKMLKDEIVRKEKNSNAEFAEMLLKLERGENIIDNLQQKLAQKEESRQGMEVLVRKLENDIRMNAATIECLRVELETLQNENCRRRLQNITLLKNDLEHIAEIVFLHKENDYNDEKERKNIEKRISFWRHAYFAGENEYRIVEEIVNQYLDNVMVYFRKEISLSSEADYRRVCYMFAGVSGLVIAQIMGESKEVVYQRRTRLLKKIASSSCKHKDMFTWLLSK